MNEETTALRTPGTKLRLRRFTIDSKISEDGTMTIEAVSGIGRGAWMGLKFVSVGYGDKTRPFTKKDVLYFLMPLDPADEFPHLVVLPGGDDNTTTTGTTSSPYFNLDSQGNSCFTEDEAEAASQHLIDMWFLNHLVSRVSTTPFLFPQERLERSTHFCNESAYGKCNILHITGLVKLAPLTTPLPPPPPLPSTTTPAASGLFDEMLMDGYDSDSMAS